MMYKKLFFIFWTIALVILLGILASEIWSDPPETDQQNTPYTTEFWEDWEAAEYQFLEFWDGGEYIVRFAADGTVEFGPGFTDDAGSRKAMRMLAEELQFVQRDYCRRIE